MFKRIACLVLLVLPQVAGADAETDRRRGQIEDELVAVCEQKYAALGQASGSGNGTNFQSLAVRCRELVQPDVEARLQRERKQREADRVQHRTLTTPAMRARIAELEREIELMRDRCP